ncbi:hypothetical protein ABBQ38_011583 [Trebouxia sp. C0009 RCD-2024]
MALMSAEDYIVCGDTPQQQLKRARLNHSDTISSEHWGPDTHGNRPSPEQVQMSASKTSADMTTSQGAPAVQWGGSSGGHHIHWMPVFCQMGSPSNYEGHVPGGPASWVQSMPSMQIPAASQGGLQPYSYSHMGPQPNTPAVAAAVANSQSPPAVEQSSPAMSTADARQSPTHDVARGGCQSAMQPQSQSDTAPTSKGGASSQHKCVDTAQGRAGEGGPALGLAACLPKLEKQLSSRSCEDLTAKAVAKLWGVNLKRYTGRSS